MPELIERYRNKSTITKNLWYSLFNKDDLDNYLKRQEEAEKRDHRKLENELDLFISTDETGPGQFLEAKGAVLRQIIEDYSKKAHSENG